MPRAPKPRRSGTDDDRFTAERIHALLRDVVDGANAVDICLAENISPATFHDWQRSYFGMTVEQIDRVRRRKKRRIPRFVGPAAAIIAGAGAVYAFVTAGVMPPTPSPPAVAPLSAAVRTAAASPAPASAAAPSATAPGAIASTATASAAATAAAPAASASSKPASEPVAAAATKPAPTAAAPSAAPEKAPAAPPATVAATPATPAATAAATPPAAASAAPEKRRYTMQLAAVPDAVEAEILVDRLTRDGYQASITKTVANGVTLHRVRVGPIEGREAADATARRLEERGYPPPWIIR